MRREVRREPRASQREDPLPSARWSGYARRTALGGTNSGSRSGEQNNTYRASGKVSDLPPSALSSARTSLIIDCARGVESCFGLYCRCAPRRGNTMARYARVLVKLSGGALSGSGEFGFDKSAVDLLADELVELADLGVQVAV